jgi:hypothetical protein
MTAADNRADRFTWGACDIELENGGKGNGKKLLTAGTARRSPA